MNSKPIRVLLVDDSLIALEMLARVLKSDPEIEVVAKVTDPKAIVSLIRELKPDIACIDYFMPGMTGLELTEKIMDACPLPILIISGQLVSKESQEIFSVLEAGALDFVPKPTGFSADNEESKKLIEKIHVLSKVYVISKQPHNRFIRETKYERKVLPYRVIVIGASTGGPTALASLLGAMPRDFSVPIVCVQHISKGFLEGFADWMQAHCALKIKIISDLESMQPGYVYLPVEDTHLEFNKNGQMLISRAPPVQKHRPAIDITMASAARAFGKEAIGVILTGMGNDGARGILEIYQAGGMTIAQDEESCIVFGMPKEAIDLHAVKYILSLNEIAPFLIKLVKPRVQ